MMSECNCSIRNGVFLPPTVPPQGGSCTCSLIVSTAGFSSDAVRAPLPSASSTLMASSMRRFKVGGSDSSCCTCWPSASMKDTGSTEEAGGGRGKGIQNEGEVQETRRHREMKETIGD